MAQPVPRLIAHSEMSASKLLALVGIAVTVTTINAHGGVVSMSVGDIQYQGYLFFALYFIYDICLFPISDGNHTILLRGSLRRSVRIPLSTLSWIPKIRKLLIIL